MSFAHQHDATQGIPDLASPPTAPGDRSDQDLVAVMVQRILAARPRSGTEALRLLRDAFPDTSLPLRVAALNMTMDRRGLRLLPRRARP